LNVRDIDGILRAPRTQMPLDPATENSEVLNLMPLKAFAGQQHDAHIAAHLMMGMSPMLQANPQAAMVLQQHMLEHIRLKAEEAVEAELFQQYGTDPDRMISAIQKEGMIALKVAEYTMEAKSLQSQLAGDQGGADPVVQLKQQELQIRAQNDQMDNQIDQARLQIEQQKAQEVARANQARVQSQENIAQLRAQVARERLTQVQGAQNAPKTR